ncbi:MAG: hypothetical protein ABSG16_15415 [Candidatus Acidiferrum sp.]
MSVENTARLTGLAVPDAPATAQRSAPGKTAARSTPASKPHLISPLWLAFSFILLLASSSLLPRVSENANLAWSIRGSAMALLALLLYAGWHAKRIGRVLGYEYGAKSVHYVQLMMHISVYSYWGWYWRPVYHEVPLILVQMAFGYALDMLVCWCRREKWIFGFGPIPIILSTNLFLWFRDDWFLLQLALIAVGVLGKEFLKWKREGKMVHIFNPSALSLFLFSVVLLATKTTGLTWGIEISTTLHRPPHIYLEIFLLGLVVQSLFQVTLVTLSAAGALVAMNLVYTHTTGVYHFVDSSIPVSVFLGLHLLVTDPATSPRKYLGKFIFGLMYGVGVFVAFGILAWYGAPAFYDKLLCVPILNLCVRALDRWSENVSARLASAGWQWKWTPRMTNFAFMGLWVALFVAITASGFLAKGTAFPGGNVAFWQQACQDGRWKGCTTWATALNAACEDNARDKCLELGQLLDAGKVVKRDPAIAGVSFGRACDLGLAAACNELVSFVRDEGGGEALEQSCGLRNGASCFILGSLYSQGAGVAQDGRRALQLFESSCAAGWWRGCGRLAQSYLLGQGTAPDPALAVKDFEKGCQGGNSASCAEVAMLYNRGIGGVQDHELAMRRLKRACDLGLLSACSPQERARAAKASMAP